MAFASGFILVAPHYREEPKRSEVRKHLENLGFEVYDVGKPAFLVFYVEAPNPKILEDVIKTAETHEGIIKAYIVFGFLADNSVKEWINDALARGEIELDESILNMIKDILVKLSKREPRD